MLSGVKPLVPELWPVKDAVIGNESIEVKANGKKGIILKVKVEKVDNDTAIAFGSWISSPEGSGRDKYWLEKNKEGKWVVKKKELDFIS